ncbi:MAG TPA: DUF1186 domain-containing protein [Allosphingosinicella sp.]
MDEEQAAAIEEIRRRAGPIEDHLDALAASRPELPIVALGVCTALIDESGPPLRALLDRAAAGEALSGDERRMLFAGVHILGAARDPKAGESLLRLLRRPIGEIDGLLGDAVTETLPRIAVGVFDGDSKALFDVVADRSGDEYVRDALIGAATFLTWEGRIGLDEMRTFLERFHRERLADDEDFVWCGWEQAIVLLGLRDLAPLVREAWAEGRVLEEMADADLFDSSLAEAERAPADGERFRRARLGYIEDIVQALDWCAWYDDSDEADPAWDEDEEEGWLEPVVNPLRHVGRNDPCPCGSGKKFKKCCISEDGAGAPFN